MQLKIAPVVGALLVAFPLVVIAQDQSVAARNLSNVKQADLALLMYANDWDDLFPYGQSTGAVIEVAQPYIRSIPMFWTVDGRRLLFNQAIGGVNQTKIAEPTKTVMWYADRADATGMREVGYVDGHAKRLGSDAWAEAEKTLHAKFPRSAKPLPASLGARYNTPTPPQR